MKLVIFGANGPTGRLVTTMALAEGHTVTAITRRPGSFPLHNAMLSVIGADVLDANAVERAVAGQEVVISALGVSLVALARGADLLVQCCFLADVDLTAPARGLLAATVIATSGQAGKIAARAEVKGLVLTHIGATSPKSLAAIAADVRQDFVGPFTLGTDLLSLEI